jgi:mannose/fructose-specific phosphotransferase system component IIA
VIFVVDLCGGSWWCVIFAVDLRGGSSWWISCGGGYSCNIGGVIFVVDLRGGSWWCDLGGVISAVWW